MIKFQMLFPHQEYELGYLPEMLSPLSKDKAVVQFDRAYSHGGGWRPFRGHKLEPDNTLTYPGDPPMKPIAMANLGDERIMVYPHAWVLVMQPDNTWEICRMD